MSNQSSTKSPFIVGNVIDDPSKFWGRKQEIQDIVERLRTSQSTSIIGARRIGKTSLAWYIYKEGQKKFGDEFEFVWLDGQSNHTQSLDRFFKAVGSQSTIGYISSNNKKECLINFEDAINAHTKKVVIIINELETLTDEEHKDEFDIPFFNTLRLLASQSRCVLITTSYTSLKDVCKHILGVSSPFYNIFIEKMLSHFTSEEANEFLHGKHDDITLEDDEIEFVKTKVSSYRHPLILQLACDSVFKNRQKQLEKNLLKDEIENQVSYFLTHQEVKEGRRMTNRKNDNPKIGKAQDLTLSILIPVIGIGLLMLEFGLLIRNLSNFQAVLLAIVSAMIGFAVLVFAGRSIDIIGETTFYKLFLQLVKQIPLLANLADQITNLAGQFSKDK